MDRKILGRLPYLLLMLSPLTLAAESTTTIPEWIDQQHQRISQGLDHQAEKIDAQFGPSNPYHPAQASLRIILDNSWQEKGDYHLEPRIRGSIKLPALENKLRLMFGDDTLDDELTALPYPNLNNGDKTNQSVVLKDQAKKENSSVALRWLGLSTPDMKTDLDIGVRSHFDVYAKAKVGKEWQLQPNLQLYGEQLLRYGTKSKGFYRTFLNLHYQTEQWPDMFDQTVFQYEQRNKNQGVYWENRPFLQQSFFPNQTFSYGVLVAGHTKNNADGINSYGPWLSWRQPLFRPWFIVQTDVNYFNNQDLNQNHQLSVLLRLETVF